MEIWKKIAIDCLKKYEVSTFGNVRHEKHKKILKQSIHRSGHLFIRFSLKGGKKDNFYVHRLVALTFIRDSDLVVNHKNNIKTDNRVENLEFVTQRENTIHYFLNYYKGKKGLKCKIIDLFNSRKWDSAETFMEEIIKL